MFFKYCFSCEDNIATKMDVKWSQYIYTDNGQVLEKEPDYGWIYFWGTIYG